MTVRPAKTQNSLGIRPVWSESSLSAWWKLGPLATHWVHSEDSDQTGRMPRLIWVFTGRALILLVLSCRGSNCCKFNFWICLRRSNYYYFYLFVCLCWGLTSQSTIFQSCRDGATASWVINQYFRGVKCLAQGHNTAAVGIEPPTSCSGVRHSTTEPPRSPTFTYLSKKWKKKLQIAADKLREWYMWAAAPQNQQNHI